jgi:hypothetical protein
MDDGSGRLRGAFDGDSVRQMLRRLAGELGALLDKGFFAQDLPKFSPNAELASGRLTEAVLES